MPHPPGAGGRLRVDRNAIRRCPDASSLRREHPLIGRKGPALQGSERSNRLLIATDGSPGSLAAAEEGVRLAKLLGAGVTFVGVANAPLPVLGDPYYQLALSRNLGAMRAALAKSTPYAVERHVEYETELLEGSPAKVVLDLARSRDVDLIVVGSRGLVPAKGPARERLLGDRPKGGPSGARRPADRPETGRSTRIAV